MKISIPGNSARAKSTKILVSVVGLGGLGATCSPRNPGFAVQTRLRSMDFSGRKNP